MENIDYKKLLEDWAEELYKIADGHKEKADNSDVGSYKHGYHQGAYDAYYLALARLSTKEVRQKRKYIKE